jgi:hypothetical protein
MDAKAGSNSSGTFSAADEEQLSRYNGRSEMYNGDGRMRNFKVRANTLIYHLLMQIGAETKGGGVCCFHHS